jgi:hypothetical protein
MRSISVFHFNICLPPARCPVLGDDMLRILGSSKKLCSGISRREMLRAGGLGLFGLGLADYLRLSDAQATTKPKLHASFGKAKACILLYLYGSPSQLETFDMKPDAPVEIRGEFKPIPSSVPGLPVCELLPNLAKQMHLTTVIRSVTHPYPLHGVAYATTGTPAIDVPMELNPRDGRHHPFIGSVVDYLTRSAKPRAAGAVPTNIALPFPFSSKRVGEVARAGPYAAFLGSAYNPIWTEFHGSASRNCVKTLQEQRYDGPEPYMGITPESRFELATATELPSEMTLDRLDGRRSLLNQFDDARRELERTDTGKSHDHYRQMAYGLIGSEKIRDALNIQKEPRHVREMYGMTLFGQASLAARRLVEAGSKFVTVTWDEFGLAGSAWDTHWNHYPRMKNELMPGFDMGFSGLLADLQARGMLDDTLVLCLSEHGRTPKIQSEKGGGRDHWSQCYSVAMAGGGVGRGRVIGKSDKIAGTVAERPVSPKDILATTYHLLGIDPETTLIDRTNRPMPLVQNASVIPELLI